MSQTPLRTSAVTALVCLLAAGAAPEPPEPVYTGVPALDVAVGGTQVVVSTTGFPLPSPPA